MGDLIGKSSGETELINLIKIGEGINLEFKESLSKELKKEIKFSICAFSNTIGGKILVGVKDSGKVIGIECGNNILAELQHMGRKINPNIRLKVDYVGKDGIKDGIRLNKNQLVIMNEIKNNSDVTVDELVLLVDINKRNVEKNIAVLKGMNIIKRIGSRKSGSWEVIE